jgi:hypothetical protein
VPVTSVAFDAEAAASTVMAALRPLADPERAGQAKRYLKSDLAFLGVSVPGIRAAVIGADRSLRGLGRYATPMLAEKEFFIRKAIGWVLRETAKKDPAYVATWTRSHLAQMSGVTFTEAVRRLPAGQAAELRAVYRKPAAS